jgi:hypothetical protein
MSSDGSVYSAIALAVLSILGIVGTVLSKKEFPNNNAVVAIMGVVTVLCGLGTAWFGYSAISQTRASTPNAPQVFVPYEPQVFGPAADGKSPWGGILHTEEEKQHYINIGPGWRKSSRKSRKSRKNNRKN